MYVLCAFLLSRRLRRRFLLLFRFSIKIDISNAKLYLFTIAPQRSCSSCFWQLTHTKIRLSMIFFFLSGQKNPITCRYQTWNKWNIHDYNSLSLSLGMCIQNGVLCVSANLVYVRCQFNSLEFFSFFILEIELNGVCVCLWRNKQSTNEKIREIATNWKWDFTRMCPQKEPFNLWLFFRVR